MSLRPGAQLAQVTVPHGKPRPVQELQEGHRVFAGSADHVPKLRNGKGPVLGDVLGDKLLDVFDPFGRVGMVVAYLYQLAGPDDRADQVRPMGLAQFPDGRRRGAGGR